MKQNFYFLCIKVGFWLSGTLFCGVALAQNKPTLTALSKLQQAQQESQTLYRALMAEMQLSQGNHALAFAYMLETAKQTKQPEFFVRAIDIAMEARAGESALTAAQTWGKILPQDTLAWRYQLQLLLAVGKLHQTPEVIQSGLGTLSTLAERKDFLLTLPPTFKRLNRRGNTLTTLAPLWSTLTDPTLTATKTVVLGRLQLAEAQFEEALISLNQAYATDKTDVQVAWLALELVERGRLAAQPILNQFLASPQGKKEVELRQAVAQVAIQDRKWEAAIQQLQKLNQDAPQHPIPWQLHATALIGQKKWSQAEQKAQQFLQTAKKAQAEILALLKQQGDLDDEDEENKKNEPKTAITPTTQASKKTNLKAEQQRHAKQVANAYLLLATLAEEQHQWQPAEQWLSQIEGADWVIPVTIKRATLLAKQGQLTQARTMLREAPFHSLEERKQIRISEAQMLRDQQQHQEAYQVYREVLALSPLDYDTLYHMGLYAEKAQQFEEMEQYLRRAIEMEPDQPHAYNALGYSLADRSVKLTEAKAFIEKALKSAPDDPQIQDSLGWVEFRLGNTQQALRLLKQAYQQLKDTEIANHLGEVLWVSGKTQEARSIWAEGLRLEGSSPSSLNALKQTLKRLNVTLP